MTDQIVRIRITLDDMQPAICRRVELPPSKQPQNPHLALQAVMLFENYHLFRFAVGEASCAIPFYDEWMEPPVRDAANIRLGKLLERGVTTFVYTYDFGDDWLHSVEIGGVFPADSETDYPRFVDGERRAPPEDVGGLPGFEEFLDAMAKPRSSARKSLLEWY